MSVTVYKRKTDGLYSITLTDYNSISAGNNFVQLYLKPKDVNKLRNALNKLRLNVKYKGG